MIDVDAYAAGRIDPIPFERRATRDDRNLAGSIALMVIGVAMFATTIVGLAVALVVSVWQ